jgi:hypothetical protein
MGQADARDVDIRMGTDQFLDIKVALGEKGVGWLAKSGHCRGHFLWFGIVRGLW